MSIFRQIEVLVWLIVFRQHLTFETFGFFFLNEQRIEQKNIFMYFYLLTCFIVSHTFQLMIIFIIDYFLDKLIHHCLIRYQKRGENVHLKFPEPQMSSSYRLHKDIQFAVMEEKTSKYHI